MTNNRPQNETDTRAQARRLLDRDSISVPKTLVKVLISCLCSLGMGWYLQVNHPELAREGRLMFMILIFAGGLWMSEAIPAFAVGLLVMVLEIISLTSVGGSEITTWPKVLAPWSSPLLWLFFGGFVLSLAGKKVGLDAMLAKQVINRFGKGPGVLLAGIMGLTFLLSMFISNTATTAMIVAMLAPSLALWQDRPVVAKGILLGVPLAATLGGMGSIIGSPPNAIAIGSLRTINPIDFIGWMKVGFVPALVLTVLAWCYLRLRYLRVQNWENLNLPPTSSEKDFPSWQRPFVAFILLGTIVAWMTQSWHGWHPALVAFFAVTALTVTGSLAAADMRKVPWEVLLLMAGGLALGNGVRDSGLATWFGSLVPEGLSVSTLAIILAFLAVGLSNFMSNTAAASVLIPLGIALSAAAPPGVQAQVVVTIALVCSCATLLPVSTPPNAIAYASGKLEARDFLVPGLALIIIGPLLINLWVKFIM